MLPISVVWFKRDLRIQDHEALMAAQAHKLPILFLYILDNDLYQDPHYDIRHWQFVRDSLADLASTLQKTGHKLHVFEGKTVEILKELSQLYKVNYLFSHQETGLASSYTIDKNVKKFCKSQNIQWLEFQHNGVIRGIQNRENWLKKWYAYMESSPFDVDLSSSESIIWDTKKYEPLKLRAIAINKNWQRGGHTLAQKVLESFTSQRAEKYMQSISKPTPSRTHCSRLSPHIAWGTMSIRTVYQAAKIAKSQGNKRNLNAFMSRLRWHDHFVQKFEQECALEFEPQNKAYSNLDWEINQTYITTWESGTTGIPMVDACMRCLIETGYLNFRMRAMLVSFFTHCLMQPWQLGVVYLATLFVDFEPGIHYPQFQMQASVTGINTIRIYNPIKQGMEHDPMGEFVKKWIPELHDIPSHLVHEPWKILPLEKIMYPRLASYPDPIVDVTENLKIARKTLWGLKNSKAVKEGKKEVLAKHTISGNK